MYKKYIYIEQGVLVYMWDKRLKLNYNWTGEVNSFVEHELVSLLSPTYSHSRFFS